MQAQLAFWLLAAPDGHAENFSIFLERGGDWHMTPLYDVLSAWPIIGEGPNQWPFKRVKLAMALRSNNVHYRVHEIQARHWRHWARQAGIAFDRLESMVDSVPAALDRVEGALPQGFPRAICTSISEGMRMQARRFVGGLAADLSVSLA